MRGGAAARTVGRGAGLTDADYARKVSVIEQALALHQPSPERVDDILASLGGLDLAAMTGVYLGAAAQGLPVIIDGFISVVAALCAVRIAPPSAITCLLEFSLSSRVISWQSAN